MLMSPIRADLATLIFVALPAVADDPPIKTAPNVVATAPAQAAKPAAPPAAKKTPKAKNKAQPPAASANDVPPIKTNN